MQKSLQDFYELKERPKKRKQSHSPDCDLPAGASLSHNITMMEDKSKDNVDGNTGAELLQQSHEEKISDYARETLATPIEDNNLDDNFDDEGMENMSGNGTPIGKI